MITGIGKKLGSRLPVGGVQLTLFIPSKDQTGASIDQAKWRDEALKCFGHWYRGATAFPPGKGVWRDDSNSGNLLFEEVVMVISYVSSQDFEKHLNDLRKFLHRLGREAGQGEMGIIIDGEYYGITEYDE